MTKKPPRSFVEKDAAEWEHDGWTSCPNSILRHPELPWELRAVWAWLASHTTTFELTAEKLRQAGPKGRDWAYNALKELERWGLLTRHHELADGGQPVIRYRLHHRPVPEERRTFEPSKAAPRVRQHPGAKERTPGGSGMRSEQGVPGGSGIRAVPDPPGSPVPDRSGVPYKEEKTMEKINQPGPGSERSAEPGSADPGWLDGQPHPEPQAPAAPTPGVRFLASLPPSCRPDQHAVARLAPKVEALLACDWTADTLRARLTAGIDSAHSPAGALVRRLEGLPLPKGVQAAAKPPWCGECDERTRQRETADDRVVRCRVCHPLAVGA